MQAVSTKDRERLRALAHKWMEASQLPIMAERTKRWMAHNKLAGDRPMIVMEMDSFASDMIDLSCEDQGARALERLLVMGLTLHELVDDDKVITPYLELPIRTNVLPLNVRQETARATDSQGRSIGYMPEHIIKELPRDLALLGDAPRSYDREGTEGFLAFAQELIGDIVPLRLHGTWPTWSTMPMNRAVLLMGMEELYVAMALQPDDVHALLDMITTDAIRTLQWLEREGLLTPNTGLHYAGAGSIGLTDEVPYQTPTKLAYAWGNTNAQEAVGISPAMFHDFVMPYATRIAEVYGLMYYGCCEAVHAFWEDIRTLPHLRKVSISPWCDEEAMGERLAGSSVIYSRKPSPNYIGVATTFDEEAFAAHIRRTLLAARGCTAEIIFRDTYTVMGERGRPGRAVRIVRRLIEEIWR